MPRILVAEPIAQAGIDLLTAAAPRLSVVGVGSVGTDRIDLAAATHAGVMVVNAPTGSTTAAAEHTMALMLSLMRRIPTADAAVRRGEWDPADRGGPARRGGEVRDRRDGLLVSEVHAGSVSRGCPLGWIPRGDERALRPGQEDAAGAGPGVPGAVRDERHLPDPCQPV